MQEEQILSDPFPTQTLLSLRDHVYDRLRDAILSGVLVPGQRIIERELATRMGISTTPVKEALRRLEQDGLIITQPRRGAIVSDLALTSAEEIVEIRANLEGIAARLAAFKMSSDELAALQDQISRMAVLTEQLDHEALFEANSLFHEMIRRGSRNRMLNLFVRKLQPFDYSVRRRALTFADEAQRGLKEHTAICEALMRRDGVAAEARIREHILRTLQFVIGQARQAQNQAGEIPSDGGRAPVADEGKG